MTIGNRQPPRLQSAIPLISQNPAPGFFAFPFTALAGQQHFFAIHPGADHDQQRRLAIFNAGLHVKAIGPHVDDFHRRQILLFPIFEFELPFRLQPLDRGSRQRRSISQQSAQRQLEIALGQPVQIQLRKHPAQLFRLPMKHGNDAAFEAFLGVSHARAAHLDRPTHHAEIPPPTMPVPIHAPIRSTMVPLGFAATDELRYFLFE